MDPALCHQKGRGAGKPPPTQGEALRLALAEWEEPVRLRPLLYRRFVTCRATAVAICCGALSSSEGPVEWPLAIRTHVRIGSSMVPDDRLHLLAVCALPGVSWYAVARAAQEPDGLDRLLRGEATETSSEGAGTAKAIREGLGELPAHVDRAREEVAAAEEKVGAKLVTVLDDGYPANLRLIFNLPPFLFVRGELRRDDVRSVAVVGTRDVSTTGTDRARKMAAALVGEGVTVLSGLAAGVDTAAHEAVLEAGGRTIAVMGTGILRTYPAKNKELAEHIARSGALVSQFWPTQPPAKHTFPRRNVVMSGMGQGTVVIEASRTSGAKMQARLALQHGKIAFLVESLVTDQEWARDYLRKYPRAVQISEVQEVIDRLRSTEAVEGVTEGRRQLALDLA
jgi:DNA processing protein